MYFEYKICNFYFKSDFDEEFFLWVPNKISCERLSTDLTYLLWS
jgi:hypothetical protein